VPDAGTPTVLLHHFVSAGVVVGPFCADGDGDVAADDGGADDAGPVLCDGGGGAVPVAARVGVETGTVGSAVELFNETSTTIPLISAMARTTAPSTIRLIVLRRWRSSRGSAGGSGVCGGPYGWP